MNVTLIVFFFNSRSNYIQNMDNGVRSREKLMDKKQSQ